MKNGPYILVKAPSTYPGKKYRGKYCYEHHLVYWQNTGLVPGAGQVVHHLNEIKTDNRFENLDLKALSDHVSEHHEPAAMSSLVCTHCSRDFELATSEYKFKTKQGQTNFFCGRSCQVTQQWIQRRSSI